MLTLRKILNRFPWIPLRWEIYDAVNCTFLLSRHRRTLQKRFENAKEPEEFYGFASGPPELFPPHQAPSEICAFLRHAATARPKVALEIGTAQSGTNFLLGQCLGSLELIIGIDLQPRNLGLLSAFKRGGLDRVIIRGSSRDSRVVSRVKELLSGRLIDVLFIDGDHAYDGVKSDFETYWPLVAEGGLVAFHDIVEDSRTRSGRVTERWAGDAPRYWREVSTGRDGLIEFIEDPDQDGLGIGAFSK